MKKIIISALLMAGVMGAQAQDNFSRGIFNHVGLNAGVGTEGISVSVAAPVTNFLEVEAGVNFMPSFSSLLEGDVETSGKGSINVDGRDFDINYRGNVTINGDLSRTTVNLKANVYPFGGNSKFFVAAGLSMGGGTIAEISGHSASLENYINEFPNKLPEEFRDKLPADYKEQIRKQIAAKVADYDVTFDEHYNAYGEIRVNSVRPYLGLGFGRLVPKNRIGVRFEAGCQFMGNMKVYQDGKEVNISKALNDAGADDDISKFINDFTVYPVIKLSICGRIF